MVSVVNMRFLKKLERNLQSEIKVLHGWEEEFDALKTAFFC